MPFGVQPGHLIVLFVVCLMCTVPVLVVVGVAYTIASRSSKNQGQLTTPTSLEILNTRYAKGEITTEQFDQMKKDLEP